MESIKEFQVLIGKIVVDIKNKDDEELIFTLDSGDQYMFYHRQDCCESVRIEDIIGNIDDLLNSPILMAEEVIDCDKNPEDKEDGRYQDSFTWTFYKFATIKGYVTIRWYGESNGYYSESVNFCKIVNKEAQNVI